MRLLLILESATRSGVPRVPAQCIGSGQRAEECGLERGDHGLARTVGIGKRTSKDSS